MDQNASVGRREYSMSKLYTIYGEPVPKPRMTQRDKWATRPCVLRYWDWVNTARATVGSAVPSAGPVSLVLRFYLPRPVKVAGDAHIRKPDLDNLCKAMMDACIPRDQRVTRLEATKQYDDGKGCRVEMEIG